ncbi:MAG: hypothetical protein ACD_73C00338G0002 [uncultured bacterium]|nr:MAG: hypothetical protein ACD_73C00338G0002 [uncultured bacterium]
MPLLNKKFNIIVLEPNELHFQCLQEQIKSVAPKSIVTPISEFDQLRLLTQNTKRIHLLIIEPHKQNIDLVLIKQIIHPSRVIILTTHPSVDKEHFYLENGFDLFYSKNRATLDKLSIIIKRILHNKFQDPSKLNQFEYIKQNLKLLSHIMNHPSLGIKMGKKQWVFVESEVEKIKSRLKNLV